MCIIYLSLSNWLKNACKSDLGLFKMKCPESSISGVLTCICNVYIIELWISVLFSVVWFGSLQFCFPFFVSPETWGTLGVLLPVFLLLILGPFILEELCEKASGDVEKITVCDFFLPNSQYNTNIEYLVAHLLKIIRLIIQN